jgi:hypothetical protein
MSKFPAVQCGDQLVGVVNIANGQAAISNWLLVTAFCCFHKHITAGFDASMSWCGGLHACPTSHCHVVQECYNKNRADVVSVCLLCSGAGQ